MPDQPLVIKNGLFFDGTGAPPAVRHLRIEGGKVARISPSALDEAGARVIDAQGQWIVPGFIDIHTHYDAEVEAAPSLSESLRHGVTTVFLGSCSLSVGVGDADDLTDQFTRVEAIPEAHLRPLLKAKKTWSTLTEYTAHLESLPLGPNLASFVGYSAVRAHVMGLERSLSPKQQPSADELQRILAIVDEGFDNGFIGVSTNTLYWDKMGGDRFRSRCLPSTYASWSEFRKVVARARERGLVFQTIPNVSTKYEALLVGLMSAGFFVRKRLKTAVVSLMDIRSSPGLYRLLEGLGWFFNTVLGAELRFQALPVPFDLHADGFELVVFEEFGAGAAGLHLKDLAERRKLFDDPGYRAWFRAQWRNPFIPKVFHRNFGMAEVLACPDTALVGKTFEAIASERGATAVDTFLDLVGQYGSELRWYTVMGNDRPGPLASILDYPGSLIGFSDAGAHLRNMAFYNFPLRMLKFVRDAQLAGRPFTTTERGGPPAHRRAGRLVRARRGAPARGRPRGSRDHRSRAPRRRGGRCRRGGDARVRRPPTAGAAQSRGGARGARQWPPGGGAG